MAAVLFGGIGSISLGLLVVRFWKRLDKVLEWLYSDSQGEIMIQEIIDAINAGESHSRLKGRVDTMIAKSISQTKAITKREPQNGYDVHENSRNKAIKLELKDIKGNEFSVFIRSHIELDYSYSIGLDYIPSSNIFAVVPIVRYNGPHDPERKTDHRPSPHIHQITVLDILKSVESGFQKIKLRDAENTDEYNSFQSLLHIFPLKMNISDFQNYVFGSDFPSDNLQERLFQ